MHTVADYQALLTSQYRRATRFNAAVAALVGGHVDAQAVLASLGALYDVDKANGVQLDVLGVWVGLARRLTVPIPNSFFSFNTPGVGFNEGAWYSGSDPLEGVIELDDATYRLMIHAKIAANGWDGSLGGANDALRTVFGDAEVSLEDNMDMTISIDISGSAPSVLFQALVQQGYVPFRPAGVGLF